MQNIYDYPLLLRGEYNPKIVHQSIIGPDGKVDLKKYQRGVTRNENKKLRFKFDKSKKPLGSSEINALSAAGENTHFAKYIRTLPLNPHLLNYIRNNPNRLLIKDYKDFSQRDLVKFSNLTDWHENVGSLEDSIDRIPDLLRKGIRLDDDLDGNILRKATGVTNQLMKDPSEFYRLIRVHHLNKYKPGHAIPFYGPTSASKNPLVPAKFIRQETFETHRAGIPQFMIIKPWEKTRGVFHNLNEQEVNLSPFQELKVLRDLGKQHGLHIIETKLQNSPRSIKDNRHMRLVKSLHKLEDARKRKALSGRHKDRLDNKINQLSYRLYGPKYI